MPTHNVVASNLAGRAMATCVHEESPILGYWKGVHAQTVWQGTKSNVTMAHLED